MMIWRSLRPDAVYQVMLLLGGRLPPRKPMAATPSPAQPVGVAMPVEPPPAPAAERSSRRRR